jgi:hypothetical protein
MTAWEALTAGSTLPSGTAWQHLNAQGGSGPGIAQFYGEIEAEYLMADIDAEIDLDSIVAEIEDAELDAELDDNTIEAEIE